MELSINENIDFSTKMHASVYIGVIKEFDKETWEITFRVPLIIDNLDKYPKAAPLFHHNYELFPNDEVVVFVTTHSDPTQCYYLPITIYKFMGLKHGVNFVDITKDGIIDLETENFYTFAIGDSEHRTLGRRVDVSGSMQVEANDLVVNVPVRPTTQTDIIKNRTEPVVVPRVTGVRSVNVTGVNSVDISPIPGALNTTTNGMLGGVDNTGIIIFSNEAGVTKFVVSGMIYRVIKFEPVNIEFRNKVYKWKYSTIPCVDSTVVQGSKDTITEESSIYQNKTKMFLYGNTTPDNGSEVKENANKLYCNNKDTVALDGRFLLPIIQCHKNEEKGSFVHGYYELFLKNGRIVGLGISYKPEIKTDGNDHYSYYLNPNIETYRGDHYYEDSYGVIGELYRFDQQLWCDGSEVETDANGNKYIVGHYWVECITGTGNEAKHIDNKFLKKTKIKDEDLIKED